MDPDKFNTMIASGLELKMKFYQMTGERSTEAVVNLVVEYFKEKRSISVMYFYYLICTVVVEFPVMSKTGKDDLEAIYRDELDTKNLIHGIITSLGAKGFHDKVRQILNGIITVEHCVTAPYCAPFSSSYLITKTA